MKKRLFAVILVLLLLVSCSCSPTAVPESEELEEDVRGKDLSSMDMRGQMERLNKLTYDGKTKWPSADKLPEDFDPQELMEWGKNPGLGVRWLHEMGYTGKGVNVAFIDQPLERKAHPEVKEIDLHYYNDIILEYEQKEHTSFHGRAVLSMIAGKSVGVAPEASVYYASEPSWLEDQNIRAEAIRKLIQVNETLPEAKKIRVIGISNNINDEQPNKAALEAAVAEAEQAGIFVMFCGEFNIAVAETMADRDDFAVYHPLNRSEKRQLPYENGALYVPVDRTYAGYETDHENDYIRDYYGGLSWTAPYVTGLMAIGLQIDPTLTGEEMLALMKETAYRPKGITSGGLIDPVAFAKRVAKDAGKELSPLGE